MAKLPLGDFYDFSSKEVQQLLHNKFVVILGDSIQRTIYKDLMGFLQDGRLLTLKELLVKGGETFRNDRLVEGSPLNRNTNYREVRQYRTDHHLVRFYFITRVYSNYVESILEDFKDDPAPDVVILNSCLWDLNRYLNRRSNEPPLQKAFREYRSNLKTLFEKLHDILPTSSLIIWNTTMPVAEEVTASYLELGMENETTPADILRANFEGATLASCYQFDVLDLNFCFRFFEECRANDGVHWNMFVHRYITKLLLTHVAKAWGVDLKEKRPQNGIAWNGNANWHCGPRYQPPPRLPPPRPPPPRPPLCHPSPQATYANGLPFAQFNPSHDPNFQHDPIPGCGSFLNFEDEREPPAHPEEVQYGDFHGPADYAPDYGGPAVDQVPGGVWWIPPPPHPDYVPNGGPRFPPPHPRGSPRGSRGSHRNGRVMRHQRFYGEHYRPYVHPSAGAGGRPPFQTPPYVGCRGW